MVQWAWIYGLSFGQEKEKFAMAQVIQAKDVTLRDLKTKFGLQLVEDDQFFMDWQVDLPEITNLDEQLLDRVKAGYLNVVEYHSMLENTVKMVVLAPLLYLAGYYLPPFHLRSEESISFAETDDGVVVEGKIDVLVLKEQLWVMVIESKRASFSIEAGLAQLLAYMLANPHPRQPSFGLITTGGSFIFIKLVKDETPRYALSKVFEMRNPGNDLYTVLAVLKQLGQSLLNQVNGN
jgi:hypothetical protein